MQNAKNSGNSGAWGPLGLLPLPVFSTESQLCKRLWERERDLGDQLRVSCECYTCLNQKSREGSETQLQEKCAQRSVQS